MVAAAGCWRWYSDANVSIQTTVTFHTAITVYVYVMCEGGPRAGEMKDSAAFACKKCRERVRRHSKYE